MVFDSSTLILLAKLELLDSVSRGREILITSIVQHESTRVNTPDALLIGRLIQSRAVAVSKVVQRPGTLDKLQQNFRIDRCEASSLWLAGHLGLPVATDDGPGIKAAKVLGIPFATAVHFLIDCCRKGEISGELGEAKLEKLAKIGRYRQQIIEDARIQIRGGKH